MFGALTRAITSLWGHDEEPVSRNDHPHDGVLGKTEDVWYFDGKVTSLHNGYGLINDEVYFSQDLVTGGATPQVGQPVYVCARRRQGTGGWRAETVTINSGDTQWTDTSKSDETEACREPKTSGGQQEIIAVVTSTSNDCGHLNETISFCFEDVAEELYVPCMGDNVTAVIVTDDTTFQQHAIDVKPLRRFEFEGQVTAAMSDHGYIVCPGGVDVYFSYNACGEGYSPHRGDLVSGAAVETTRGQCQWRALSVTRRCMEKKSTEWLNRPPVWSAAQSLRELLADKEGISVTGKLDFGELRLGDDRSATVTIQNSGSCPHQLISCSVLGSSGLQFEVTLQHTSDVKVSVAPGMSTSVTIQCHAKYLGMDKRLLIFNFEDFKIGRHVTVSVRDPSQSALDPTSVYQRNHAGSRYRASQDTSGELWLVPGQRPTKRKTSSRQSTRLLQYPVPEKLRTWLSMQGDLKQVVPVLTDPLCMDNYAERFSVLLHLEELQQEMDLLEFSLDRVCLRPVGEFLALAVPGLAEGRPSLLPGDRLVLREPCEVEGGPEYEGYIHEVLKDEVLLKFHNSFHQSYQGTDYNCRFLLSRATLRRCHQAAHCAPQHGQRVLFPESLIPKIAQMKAAKLASSSQASGLVKVSPVVGIRKCPLGVSTSDKQQKHKFFNEKLNTRQRAAVMRILGGQSRPTPYILFGPPGTGKTMTVVEAVLQIFEHVPSSRLVVCAPSNSAADLLAERLHSSGRVRKSEMVRLNAFQRIEENIEATIQPYCRNADELELVARHRIIVCTCSSAALLGSLSLSSGHFTHVFVDEAGQATEPECLISTCLLSGSDGQTVLAGDPLQLGAVLRSHHAKQYHLDLSLLERLIQRPLYRRDESKFADHGSYDPFLVTKLRENYRSHPALLQLPSQLFYDGELQCSGDTSVTECMCDWDMLPNKDGCPLIFHGMRGEDMREGNSPSWFNPVEVMQVVKYVQALVSSNHNLMFDDIGVITPYRKQVEKIRLLIDRLGMEKVKVGSVEEFQGQERLAMIISTVRSNESQLGADRVHNLGFLSNPKRFNVAITRAQALLIIVGNPHILAQDPYWRALISFCISRGTYIGCDLPDVEDWLHPQGPECEAAAVGDEKGADISNDQEVDVADNQCADINNGQEVDIADKKGVDVTVSKDTDVADNADADITNRKQGDVVDKQISNGESVDNADEHGVDIIIDEEVDVADTTGADTANSKQDDFIYNQSVDVSNGKIVDAADNQGDDVINEGVDGADYMDVDITNTKEVDGADNQGDNFATDEKADGADNTDADTTHSKQDDVPDKEINNRKGVDSADELSSVVTIDEEVDVADNTNCKRVDIVDKQCANVSNNQAADDEGGDIAMTEEIDVADNIVADITNSKQVDVVDYAYPDITNGKQDDVADKQDDDINIDEKGDVADNTDADVSSSQGSNTANKNDITSDNKISGDIGGGMVMDENVSDKEVCDDSVNDTDICDVTKNETVFEDCRDVTVYEDNKDVTIYEDSTDITLYEDSSDDIVLLDVPAFRTSKGDTKVFHDSSGDTKVCKDVGNDTVCDDVKKDLCLHKNDDTVCHDDRADIEVCNDTEEYDDTSHNVFNDTTCDRDMADVIHDRDVADDTRHDMEMRCDTVNDPEECHDTRKASDDDDTLDTCLFGDKHCDTDVRDDNDIKKVRTSDSRCDSTVAPPTCHSSMIKGNERRNTCDNHRNQDIVAKHDSFAKAAGQGDVDSSDTGHVSMSVCDSKYNYNNSNSTDGLATTAKPTLLEKKIIRQLQYYFGDFNLMKDLFLQKHISNDPEGWVDLSLLVTFKRLQSLTTDFDIITTALNKCTANVVELSPCGTKVRRSTTNPRCKDFTKWKEEIKSRSVAVEGCDNNMSEAGWFQPREHIDDLQGFFEFYGDVEHIQQGIWKRMPGQRDFTELELVVFHRRESAEKVARNAPIQQSDRTLVVYFGDAVQDEAVEWLYDLHVRKIKKCRIQPVGSRRKTRASSARAADKGGRGYPGSRSQYTSSYSRNDKQQVRSFFTQQSGGSSHGRKDHSRRTGDGGERSQSHTEVDGAGRRSRGYLTRGATCHKPGWAGQRTTHGGKDDRRHVSRAAHVSQRSNQDTVDTALFPGGRKSPRSLNKDSGAEFGDVEGEPRGTHSVTHTYPGHFDSFSSIPDVGAKLGSPGAAVGRGIHVAQPLSLSGPQVRTSHDTVGSDLVSHRAVDGQNTRGGVASVGNSGQPGGERTRPSVNDPVDDNFISTHNNSPLTSVISRSRQSDASPAKDTAREMIHSAPSPIDLMLGNDNSSLADEYNALNQTDSDVIIEESGSEDDEDWN